MKALDFWHYAMVRLIDEQMGRVLQCLDDLGLADQTLVIFTTDHGELLGDHGLWMKGPFHYEELVRVPLLILGSWSTVGLIPHMPLSDSNCSRYF